MTTQTVLSTGTNFVAKAMAKISLTASPVMMVGASKIYADSIGFLKFDLPQLPVTSVVSAILRLFVLTKTENNPSPVIVNRVTKAFDVEKVTYSTKPPFLPVSSSSIDVASEDVLRYVEIDVTTLVNQWLDGTYPNYGMAITNPDRKTELQIAGHLIGDAFAPQLIIIYAASPSGGIQGIQAQLQGKPGKLIDDKTNVVFDSVITDLSPDISYNSKTGEFTISEAGNYYIAWWVVTNGSTKPDNMVFSLMVNGSPVSQYNAPIVTGQVEGDVLITVTDTPAVITLVNQTGGKVVLANTNVQANIAIIAVDFSENSL